MASVLPLEARIPQEIFARAKGLLRLGGSDVAASKEQLGTLGFGLTAIENALPGFGLLRGQVTELCVWGMGALGTTLAVSACKEAQREGGGQGREKRGLDCAFIDPTVTLYAPGLAQLGVSLERLLVLQPSPEALPRVALRVVRAGLFSLVVVDLRGALGRPLQMNWRPWVRIVRQMNLSLEDTRRTVLFLTPSEHRASIPLPVGRRIELKRMVRSELKLRIARDRGGHTVPWHTIRKPPSVIETLAG